MTLATQTMDLGHLFRRARSREIAHSYSSLTSLTNTSACLLYCVSTTSTAHPAACRIGNATLWTTSRALPLPPIGLTSRSTRRLRLLPVERVRLSVSERMRVALRWRPTLICRGQDVLGPCLCLHSFAEQLEAKLSEHELSADVVWTGGDGCQRLARHKSSQDEPR